MIRLVCALAIVLVADDRAGARAQTAPLTEIDEATEVGSIGFRFVDTQTLATSRLRDQIFHTHRGGFIALRRVFGFLPFVRAVGAHPFSPVDLARDAVRLEHYYVRNGFLFPKVDWLVRLDAARNVVSILFIIEEGPPLSLEALDYRGPDGRLAREHLADELRPAWEEFKAEAQLQTGERLDQAKLLELEEQALSWVRNRGYAFAEVSHTARVDSLANTARVAVNLDPGPRARISSIAVEGNEAVTDRVVLRELPFRPGDMFSQRRLTDGQREVFGLDIFTIALADVPPQPPDTTVDVLMRVRERDQHAITAQLGYLSEAGLMGEVEWVHRNFLGDARRFSVSGLANTGWGAFITEPDRRYRARVGLRQPYVFHRRVSVSGSAFAEYRDDFRDRSRAFGGDVTMLYERDQFRNLSASFEFEDRRVQEFRFGGSPGADPDASGLIEELFEIVAAVSPNLSRSVVSLRGAYGRVDHPLNPRRGYILRPAVQFTVPFPTTALDYQRARLNASAYLPVGERLTIAGRGSVGRLFPRGSKPGDEFGALLELLRLRDVVFLAGGTPDVRGWGPGFLGPKLIDVVVRESDGDEVTLSARNYFPYGGTMRATATAEARYGLTDTFGAFVFLDAGRVWTAQDAYQVSDDGPLFDNAYGSTDRIFFGAGGGVSLASPIGAIQVALGYKVNPSFFDVRDPGDIAAAFQGVLRQNPDASPDELRLAAEQVEPSFWRRLRLHLSIGQTF